MSSGMVLELIAIFQANLSLQNNLNSGLLLLKTRLLLVECGRMIPSTQIFPIGIKGRVIDIESFPSLTTVH